MKTKFKTMPVDEEMVEEILHAFSFQNVEGQSNYDESSAEYTLMRVLYQLYPEIVSNYHYIPSVKKAMGNAIKENS